MAARNIPQRPAHREGEEIMPQKHLTVILTPIEAYQINRVINDDLSNPVKDFHVERKALYRAQEKIRAAINRLEGMEQ